MSPKWRSFKSDPPYDWRTAVDGDIEESDPDCGFIAYFYVEKPERIMFSLYPCNFEDGVFVAFKSHMQTSPYPEDRIEVVAWLSVFDLNHHFRGSFSL